MHSAAARKKYFINGPSFSSGPDGTKKPPRHNACGGFSIKEKTVTPLKERFFSLPFF